MSQANMTLANVARTLFRANLNDALAALASCQSGTSRPTGIPAGGLWVNTTTATAWVVNLFDGTDDIAVGTVDTTTNVFTPSIAAASLTYSKIQNVSATSRVLGRVSAGAGVIEEIPVGTAANNLVRLTSGSTTTGTYSRTGTTVTVTITAHGYTTGQFATLTFTTGTATSGTYQVTSTGANTFTVVDTVSGAASGNVSAQGPVALPAVSGANITNVTKLLASGTISAVAQLDLVLSSYIAAGYTEFDLRISNLVAATNDQVLMMVVSTDGGATYQTSNYKGGGNTLDTGFTTVFSVAGGGQSLTRMPAFGVVGNTTAKAVTGVIRLFCKSQRFSFVSENGGEAPLTNQFLTTKLFGWGDQTNVNAIRLQFATGNITSLTYSLIGVA